jgi:outer membrane scaffolding protein for murein synthesis (MipA/OmpV family)
LVALLCCGRAPAQEQPTDEIAISAERQTALDNESLTVSETPDAGPHLSHMTAIVGLGALVAPVYEGSKKTKVSPFPYVDIRGLLDDRVFISDLAGIGVKILNEGLVRAGVSVNYTGGRTSSDDPHLKGLPDIKDAAQVNGYLALALKPITLEAKVQQRLGSGSGTKASFGASYNVAPLPQLHLSLSGDVTWANASYEKTSFGITPADAAAATAQGNPLPAYTPGSGLTDISFAAAGVYQVGRHWGVIGRIAVHDLVGSSAKDSPLTQRTFAPSFALGAMYMF